MNEAKVTVTAYPTPFLEIDALLAKLRALAKESSLKQVALVIDAALPSTRWLAAALRRPSYQEIQKMNPGDPLPQEAKILFYPQCIAKGLRKKEDSHWIQSLLKSKLPLEISYSLQDSLGNEILPAPWLDRFDFKLDPTDLTKIPWKAKTGLHQTQSRALLDRYIREHIFSPTELESYQTSPFQHFCRYLLKVKALEDTRPELDAGIIGQLVHRILEQVFREIGAKKDFWENENPEVLTQTGKQVALACLDEWEKKNLPFGSTLWKHRRERILRTLDALLLQEASRLKEGQFRLKPHSFEIKIDPPLTLDCDGIPIKITGVVDRIDTDPENKKFLVIDYKTGSRTVSNTSFQAGEALQLPLYVKGMMQNNLADHKPIGGIFFRLHDLTRKEGFVKASDSEWYNCLDSRAQAAYSPEEWVQILKNVDKQVRALIRSMKVGRFEAATEQCASFCDYKDICRCGDL